MAELPKSSKIQRVNHGLPDEILIEIFSRMRVKTLCKFKCVCKQWQMLISDPYFHVLHHQRSPQKARLLLLKSRFISCSKETPGRKDLRCVDLAGDVKYSMNFPRLSLSKNEEYYEVVPSSCQYFICMATKTSFFLCNPSIQEFLRLPEPTCYPSNFYLCKFFLSNLNSPLGNLNRLSYHRMTGGFGFSESKNEYVIIHLIADPEKSYDEKSYIGCEILNFSTGNFGSCSWRKIYKKFAWERIGYQRWGTFVGGAFYWRNSKAKHARIISFNLHREDFETLPPPQGAGQNSYLVEYRRNLALVDVSAQTVKMWTLRGSEDKKWTKDFSVKFGALAGMKSCSSLFETFCRHIEFFNPIEEEDGNLLFVQHEETSEKRIIWYYNMDEKSFKIENKDLPVKNIHLCLHTETLFSLRSRN